MFDISVHLYYNKLHVGNSLKCVRLIAVSDIILNSFGQMNNSSISSFNNPYLITENAKVRVTLHISSVRHCNKLLKALESDKKKIAV